MDQSRTVSCYNRLVADRNATGGRLNKDTRKPEDLIAVGCSIPWKLKQKIQAIAKEEDRPYQREVIRALKAHVERKENRS